MVAYQEVLAYSPTDLDIEHAKTDLAEAEAEYHATPDGMSDLERQIDETAAQGPTYQPSLTRLTEKLIRARETRKDQMAAYAATVNPVAAMANSALKGEMNDLIHHRLPSSIDAPDVLVMERARLDAVLSEMETRASSGTWNNGNDLPPAAPAPAPTVPRNVEGIDRGDMVVFPDQAMPLHVLGKRVHTNGPVPFVDLDFYNDYTHERRTRRYTTDTMLPVARMGQPRLYAV